MSKESDIMEFLHERVFDPVLSSPKASSKLKSGVRLTITRMEKLSAEKMVQYFWSAISGTERSIGFAKLMQDEGFSRFEETREEFQLLFNDQWLQN